MLTKDQYRSGGCWLGVPWFLLCFIEIEKNVVLFMEQINNDNCDQTYLAIGIFHGKVEIAIYNVE
jgi:hypothetical protein